MLTSLLEPVLFFATAFGLGAAHALEPGHGKTLVAAYLTSTQGRIRDAVVLGLVVTVCHTLSVFVLGLTIALLLSQFLKEQGPLLRAMEVLSGVIIFSIGLSLFWRRFVQDKDANECECHIQHTHHEDIQPDVIVPLEQATPRSLKTVFSLGFASGVSPCPIALAALITSMTLGGFGKLPEALLYLLVFSFGLGSVLMVLGIVLIRARDVVSVWFDKDSRWPIFMSRFSTVLLMGLGLYLIAQACFFPVAEKAGENAPVFFFRH